MDRNVTVNLHRPGRTIRHPGSTWRGIGKQATSAMSLRSQAVGRYIRRVGLEYNPCQDWKYLKISENLVGEHRNKKQSVEDTMIPGSNPQRCNPRYNSPGSRLASTWQSSGFTKFSVIFCFLLHHQNCKQNVQDPTSTKVLLVFRCFQYFGKNFGFFILASNDGKTTIPAIFPYPIGLVLSDGIISKWLMGRMKQVRSGKLTTGGSWGEIFWT